MGGFRKWGEPQIIHFYGNPHLPKSHDYEHPHFNENPIEMPLYIPMISDDYLHMITKHPSPKERANMFTIFLQVQVPEISPKESESSPSIACKWWFLGISRMFPCKPAILGHPHFWKRPCIFGGCWNTKNGIPFISLRDCLWDFDKKSGDDMFMDMNLTFICLTKYICHIISQHPFGGFLKQGYPQIIHF